MRINGSSLFVLLATAGLAVANAQETDALDLRQLDGTIGRTAAGPAVRSMRTETATAAAWWDGEYLHVNVRSQPIFVAHVCLAGAERVRVLHASSALGAVAYVRGESTWTSIDNFDWEVRDTTMSDAAVADRRRYLDINGWVGTTVGMGESGQTEFVIAARVVPPDARFAIALMPADNPESIVALTDDATGCNDAELVRGDRPDRLRFEPEKWPAVPPRKRTRDEP